MRTSTFLLVVLENMKTHHKVDFNWTLFQHHLFITVVPVKDILEVHITWVLPSLFSRKSVSSSVHVCVSVHIHGEAMPMVCI